MPYTEDEQDYFNEFAGFYWVDYLQHKSMSELADYSDHIVYEKDLE